MVGELREQRLNFDEEIGLQQSLMTMITRWKDITR